MEGKLERNEKGQVMCDKCGHAPTYSKAKGSNLMRDFIKTPFSKRKIWYLCLDCTRKFSEGSGW